MHSNLQIIHRAVSYYARTNHISISVCCGRKPYKMCYVVRSVHFTVHIHHGCSSALCVRQVTEYSVYWDLTWRKERKRRHLVLPNALNEQVNWTLLYIDSSVFANKWSHFDLSAFQQGYTLSSIDIHCKRHSLSLSIQCVSGWWTRLSFQHT